MARRRKSQARRGGDRRVPIWIWLLGGMLIGLVLSVFVYGIGQNGEVQLFYRRKQVWIYLHKSRWQFP